MPPVQTSVAATLPAGVPGQLYDLSPNNDVVSKIASEDIPFGAAVRIDGENCELADSSGEVASSTFGLALGDRSLASGEGYKAGEIVSVLRFGRAWALVEASQSIGQFAQPFVRFTAAGAEVKGALRLDADGSDAAAVPGFKMYLATSGGIGVVEVGLVGATGATGSTGPTGPQGATGP